MVGSAHYITQHHNSSHRENTRFPSTGPGVQFLRTNRPIKLYFFHSKRVLLFHVQSFNEYIPYVCPRCY